MTESRPTYRTFDPRIVSLPAQQQYDQAFPLIYQLEHPDAKLRQAQEWVLANKAQLLEQLSIHGAILFRGLPLQSDVDFDLMIQAFGLPNFAYSESLSNAVRINRTARVFTANEAPPEVSIYLHHEMAQTPLYPSKLFFFCEQAADEGGPTPLCRSDILLKRLENEVPAFIARCEEQGVRYSNVMPTSDDLQSGQGRSWQSTLSVDNAADAEARLNALGYQWHWLDDGSLRATTAVLPIVRTLDDGRRVFFNQLIAAYRGWQDSRNVAEKSISYGDGSEFATEDMAQLINLSDELTFDLQWQTGDMALLDNFLVMHGRKPYEGTRRVLAGLIAD